MRPFSLSGVDITGVLGTWPQRSKTRGKWGSLSKTGLNGPGLLVAFEPTAKYRTRFDFYGIVKRVVPKIVGKEMDRVIARALALKK